MKDIPVQNIYYLLSYAWDRLDESELTDAGIDDYEDVVNLLGKVFGNGCWYLLKRGLYRDYEEVEEEISGIKGRLLIDQSIKHLSFQNKKAWCQYDELSRNVLPNQILKETAHRLLQTDDLDKSLHEELKRLYLRFTDITSINLQFQHFSKVQIHRNNAFYGFLIEICQLLFESSAIEESGDKYKFRDFTRDPHKLRQLFEAFVFNFYKKEQDWFKVSAPSFQWSFTSKIEEHNQLLPKMFTDIVLEDGDRKIIIDTKFSSKTFAERQDIESISFKTPNLYQLYAYMQQISNQDGKKIEGILLYPDVGDSIHATYEGDGKTITFKTVDLNQEWRKIKYELLSLVELTSKKLV